MRLEVPRASRAWRWHAVGGDRAGLRVAVVQGSRELMTLRYGFARVLITKEIIEALDGRS